MKGQIIDTYLDRENGVYCVVNREMSLMTLRDGHGANRLPEIYSSGRIPEKGLYVDIRV